MKYFTKFLMQPVGDDGTPSGSGLQELDEVDVYDSFDDEELISLDLLTSETDLLEEGTEIDDEEDGEVALEEDQDDSADDASNDDKKTSESSEDEDDEEDIADMDVDKLLGQDDNTDSKDDSKTVDEKFETDENPYKQQASELTEKVAPLELENSNLKTQLQEYSVHIEEATVQLRQMNEFDNLLKTDVGQFKALVQASTGINLDEHETTQYSNNQAVIDSFNNKRVKDQISQTQSANTLASNKTEVAGFVSSFKKEFPTVTDSDINELIGEMRTNAYNDPRILYIAKNHDRLIIEAKREGARAVQTKLKTRKTKSYSGSQKGQSGGTVITDTNAPTNYDDGEVITLDSLRKLDHSEV